MSGTKGAQDTIADKKKSHGMDMKGTPDAKAPEKRRSARMSTQNAAMLLETLSEEKTEIAQLAAQQAALQKMGGRQNLRVAAMLGRWVREHKAAGPMLMTLLRRHGGNPLEAMILKPAVLGDRMQMLMADHKDHVAAVQASQMRHAITGSPAIKKAMHKRANLARKHLAQMRPYMGGSMHS